MKRMAIEVKVAELVMLLKGLDQEQEIRYDSYEFLGDFVIEQIKEEEYGGIKYYCIE